MRLAGIPEFSATRLPGASSGWPTRSVVNSQSPRESPAHTSRTPRSNDLQNRCNVDNFRQTMFHGRTDLGNEQLSRSWEERRWRNSS